MLIVIGLSVFFLYCLAVGTRHAASVYYWYVFALTHFCSHADYAKNAEFFVFTLALEGSQASLRQRAQRLVSV